MDLENEVVQRTCPNCQLELNFPVKFLGVTGKCLHCHERIFVPEVIHAQNVETRKRKRKRKSRRPKREFRLVRMVRRFFKSERTHEAFAWIWLFLFMAASLAAAVYLFIHRKSWASGSGDSLGDYLTVIVFSFAGGYLIVILALLALLICVGIVWGCLLLIWLIVALVAVLPVTYLWRAIFGSKVNLPTPDGLLFVCGGCGTRYALGENAVVVTLDAAMAALSGGGFMVGRPPRSTPDTITLLFGQASWPANGSVPRSYETDDPSLAAVIASQEACEPRSWRCERCKTVQFYPW